MYGPPLVNKKISDRCEELYLGEPDKKNSKQIPTEESIYTQDIHFSVNEVHTMNKTHGHNIAK